MLAYAESFGLILFVYTLGLQVGPGFMSTFRKGGTTLNLLALGVVALGTVIARGRCYGTVALTRYDGCALWCYYQHARLGCGPTDAQTVGTARFRSSTELCGDLCLWYGGRDIGLAAREGVVEPS